MTTSIDEARVREILDGCDKAMGPWRLTMVRAGQENFSTLSQATVRDLCTLALAALNAPDISLLADPANWTRQIIDGTETILWAGDPEISPETLALSAIASRQAVVTDQQVHDALHASVPGGAEVWHWLPQEADDPDNPHTARPHRTAHEIIRAALNSALAAPVRDEPKAEHLRYATPEHQAIGWTLDPPFLDEVNARIFNDTGYDATIEVIEAALLIGARALSQTSKPEGETR